MTSTLMQTGAWDGVVASFLPVGEDYFDYFKQRVTYLRSSKLYGPDYRP